mmetsp:Transcript_3969/g.6234  ORF Transcript_3969/g.6234 Transcript_3969/m.6234 type:complete len:80 (+) Transcript_3969:1161-1400(+)
MVLSSASILVCKNAWRFDSIDSESLSFVIASEGEGAAAFGLPNKRILSSWRAGDVATGGAGSQLRGLRSSGGVQEELRG